MREWFDYEETKPTEGRLVCVLHKNGELDKQFWTDDYCYYCDGNFYTLDYDPHLGVMRKNVCLEKVDMWTAPLYPNFPD